MPNTMDSVAELRLLAVPDQKQLKAEDILQLIAESSGRLLRAPCWRALVDDILAKLGQAAGVSRVYIFEVEQDLGDDAIVSLRYEWVDDHIEPQLYNPKLQHYSRKQVGLARWTDPLRKGEPVYGITRLLKRSEKRFMEEQHIQSIAIVPIHVGKRWWGYLGFDECRWERPWSSGDLNLLKSIATMFGAAMEGEAARRTINDSETLYRLTFEKAGSGVIHIGACFKIFRANQKSCEILGYRKDEILEHNLETLTYHEDIASLKLLLTDLGQQGLTREFEKRLVRKDRSIIWVNMALSVMFDETGEVKCFIGVFKDITEKLITERILHETKEKYQNLVDTVDDIIWTTNKNSEWTFLNPATYQITGYRPVELLGRPSIELLAPDEILKPADVLKQIHNRGRARYELKILHKSGASIVLSCNAIPTRDDQGQIIGLTGTARDITEHKTAEKALRQSQERFQIVSRATNDVIWDWHIEKNTLWSNLGLQTPFGYSEHEIEPNFSWWKKLIHPADRKRVINEIYTLMENGRNFWSSEFRFRYGNGEYANVLDRGYIIYSEEGRPVRMIGTLQDITEQKRSEQSLRDSREKLRNLASREQSVREEERKKLSRELHDEFAQILTALKMDINWFKRKLPEEYTVLQEHASVMSKVIDDTMERVRQIASELRPALLDDLGLSAAIEWQVKQFYNRTSCFCNLDIGIEALDMNKDCEIAIFRIFQETLSNIARHTHATRVDIALQQQGDDIYMVITDNGGGIPEEKIQHGDSLGLIGMRERAMAFGGRLHISSRLGVGTTINLRMPILEPVSKYNAHD